MRNRQIWVIFALVAVLVSCGPVAKLRKAEKLIAEAEKKGAVWHVKTRTDTVFRVDTIRVAGDSLKTLVKYTTDTIVVTKDKVVTKIKITPGKTVYVETKCPEKVVIKKVPHIVTNTVNKEIRAGLATWQVIGLCIFFLLLGFMANDLYRKFSKRTF